MAEYGTHTGKVEPEWEPASHKIGGRLLLYHTLRLFFLWGFAHKLLWSAVVQVTIVSLTCGVNRCFSAPTINSIRNIKSKCNEKGHSFRRIGKISQIASSNHHTTQSV